MYFNYSYYSNIVKLALGKLCPIYIKLNRVSSVIHYKVNELYFGDNDK